jgi:hypothetical protein
MLMDQTPTRGSRVDGDALMPLIAAAVSGVATFTLGSSILVAAGVTVLVGALAYAGIALRNRLRKDR